MKRDDAADAREGAQQVGVLAVAGDAHDRLVAVVVELARAVEVVVVAEEDEDGVELLVDGGVVDGELALRGVGTREQRLFTVVF